jgi:hypothetical protein
MGIDTTFRAAVAKAQIAAGTELPVARRLRDRPPRATAVVPIAAAAGVGFGVVFPGHEGASAGGGTHGGFVNKAGR